jgi:hypothetical protein
MSGKHWTDPELEILRQEYSSEKREYLANLLQKSSASISLKAYSIGIRTGRSRQDIAIRFQKYVMPEPNSGCWLWTGGTHKTGYGAFTICKRKQVSAHRISWEIHHGSIPKGLCVLHRCDTPSCVNPAHLFLGTNQENSKDCVKKKRHVYGSRYKNAKITDDVAISIRQDPRSLREISASFGISARSVFNIKHNMGWKHTANAS